MNEILNYISNNEKKYLDELFEFLSIPSISSVPENKPEVERCALWVIDALKKAGIVDVRLYPTPGHPIVFGQWMEAGDKAPTVLVYGHYDVQPVDPLDLWDSPPFEPEIRNGKIYARGSADDKGQMFTHIKAAEAFLSTKKTLPVNLKFIFEGEEEAGSSNLDDFIKNNSDLLKCDTVIISDTEWLAEGLPSICYALRGISFVEITLTGPNRDLHSGSYGGAVDNPANTLAWLISQLHDKYCRVTIPGFYDDVKILTEEEHRGFEELPYNEKEYCEDLDVKCLNGEIGYTTYERTWVRPTLDINGLWSGYTGVGAKTIIPSKASAKISMRLVPNQNYEDISNKIENYLRTIVPPTMKLEFTKLHGGNPVLVPRNSIGVKAAIKAFEQAFNKKTVFMCEGGSIPIVGIFDEILHAKSVLMGFGLPSDYIHSPNESFSVENFLGGIRTAAIFLEEFAKLNK